MSFGDHLDELRVRVLYSLLAVVVCTAVLLPFKTAVTEVYTGPYRQMWLQSFNAYETMIRGRVAEERELVAADPSRTLDPKYEEIIDWLDREGPQIRNGTFDFETFSRDVETRGRFKLPYTLAALGGIADLWVFMAATVLFGLVLSSPIVLYQAWAFVAAGLYQQERAVVLRYFPLAAGLLMAGVLFGYFVVVPYGLYFLVKLMHFGHVVPLISVTEYFSMLLTLTGALGACFQLPLVMLALVKAGICSHRFLRRNWRYVILGCFVLSAFLTPPDPFTQAMMAAPMIVLYVFGLFLTAGGGPADELEVGNGATA